MKKIIYLFCLVFLTGCYEQSTEGNTRYDRYTSWISREDFTTNAKVLIDDPDEALSMARQEASWILLNIDYDKDDPYYWKSADETLYDGYGACVARSILLYVSLIRDGVNPNLMYLVIEDDNIEGTPGHCYVVICDQDFFLSGEEDSMEIIHTFTKDYFI